MPSRSARRIGFSSVLLSALPVSSPACDNGRLASRPAETPAPASSASAAPRVAPRADGRRAYRADGVLLTALASCRGPTSEHDPSPVRRQSRRSSPAPRASQPSNQTPLERWPPAESVRAVTVRGPAQPRSTEKDPCLLAVSASVRRCCNRRSGRAMVGAFPARHRAQQLVGCERRTSRGSVAMRPCSVGAVVAVGRSQSQRNVRAARRLLGARRRDPLRREHHRHSADG